MEMLFQPLKVAPGVIWMNDRGLRIAPAPMPKLIGSSAICFPVIVMDCSALSLFSSVDSARDRDRFGGRADLQHHVNAGGDGDLYLYIGLFVFAEAGLLDGKRVGAYRQLQQRVIAGSGCDGVGLRTRLGIGEDHLDAWDQRARGIRNCSGNCAAIALT